MIYRQIGKTGMMGSIIGLGLEHVDGKPYEVVKEVIDAAFEKEINYMDIFMPGDEVRQNISKALSGRRNQAILQGHIGSVDLNQQYDMTRDVALCKTYFENLLRILHTDYIDLGMMFFLDTEEEFRAAFDTDYLTYVQNLKREGKIRAIGASSHNPVIARKVVETGIVDVLMFSINLAFDMTPASINVLDALEGAFERDQLKGLDPERHALYRLCESRGVGISVMKTFGAGKLLSPEHTPFERPMTAAQCIHYALTRPAVVSVMAGCQTKEQVYEAAAYCGLSDQDKDYTHAIGTLKSTFQRACVYCNHCLPCPAGIDIATVTKYKDIAALNPSSIPPGVRQHYRALEHKASECIACGSCESRCPFGVPVIENMRKAEELFA